MLYIILEVCMYNILTTNNINENIMQYSIDLYYFITLWIFCSAETYIMLTETIF